MTTLRSIAPIFPAADLDAPRAHYEALGFAVRVHNGGYASAAGRGHHPLPSRPRTGRRGRAGGLLRRGGRRHALHAEWCAAAVGETGDLFDPGFGVWEAAHTDPDGNLVRFGSPLPSGGS